MNQKYYQDEVEIDLLQFCKKMLEQWRAVVVVALICGAVTMCVKYAIDIKNYKQSAADVEMDVESLEESMSKEDADAVYETVRNQKALDSMEEYAKNSLYYHLNPMEVKTVRFLYRLNVYGKEGALPVIAAYKECLLSDEGLSAFATKLGLDCDSKYVRELINVDSQGADLTTTTLISDDNMVTIGGIAGDNSNGQIMVVSVLVPEGVHSQQIIEAMKKAVDESTEEVEKYGYSYQMEYYDAVERTSVDYSMQQIQKSYATQLSELKSKKPNIINGFSYKQNLLYQLLTSNADENPMEAVDLPIPQMSSKHFAIGIFVGVVLCFFLYFLYIMLSPRAVALSVSSLTNLPRVGTIKKGEKTECNLANIIGQMQVLSQNREDKVFQVLIPNVDGQDDKQMQLLCEEANKTGVLLKIVLLNVNNTRETIEKLDTSIPAVIAIFENKTLKRDVRNLYETLSLQQIKVLGELHIEEA